MFYTDHGLKHELLSALNRCVATSFFIGTHRAGQDETTLPVFEKTTRIPKSLAREKYLAIPTFIRQGKTLGL